MFQVEGIEKIHIRYQTIVSATKSKTYDVLDHRKLEVTDQNDLLKNLQVTIKFDEALVLE